MLPLEKIFIGQLWQRKVLLMGLISMTLCMGLFSRYVYQDFLYLQSQNIDSLSVFNQLLLPLVGLTLICQLAIALLTSVLILPVYAAAGQSSLLNLSRLKPKRQVRALFLPVFIFSLWPLINFLLICFSLSWVTSFDLIRLSLVAFGLFLINGLLCLILLAFNAKQQRVLSALVLSFVMLILLFAVEISINYWLLGSSLDYTLKGLFGPLLNLREGIFNSSDLMAYVGWLCLVISYIFYQFNADSNKQKTKNLIGVVIGLGIILMAGFYNKPIDMTIDARNSISPRLKSELSKIEDELIITAVINQETSRDEIKRGFSLIKSQIKKSKILFKARQNLAPEFQQAGEYVEFSLGQLQQSVSYPFEHDVKSVFESAVRQMLQRQQQWITFVEGHGEASPFNNGAADYSVFFKTLTQMGWHVAAQNLSKLPVVSDNTGLLVIAASRHKWLAGEVTIVIDYLNKGGNLLLLADPDSFVPQAIEDYIGITRHPGTLIDWQGYQSGTPHPAIVIVRSLTNHGVLKGINSLLALPWSSGLKIAKPTENSFDFEVILSSAKDVWNESNIDAEELIWNRQTELQQSFILAMSAVDLRKQQKIIVVGDSNFISDSSINNYANKQFGLNLISWLTHSKNAQLKQKNSDANISPLRLIHFSMRWLFSLVFPLMILIIWWISQWRRNHRIASLTTLMKK